MKNKKIAKEKANPNKAKITSEIQEIEAMTNVADVKAYLLKKIKG